jgi:hypothetical protein
MIGAFSDIFIMLSKRGTDRPSTETLFELELNALSRFPSLFRFRDRFLSTTVVVHPNCFMLQSTAT